MTLVTKQFYLTFGDQYRRIQHPKAINDVYPHPDGWMTLEAIDFGHAMRRANSIFGHAYSMCYAAEEFDEGARAWYPLGELARLPFAPGKEAFL